MQSTLNKSMLANKSIVKGYDVYPFCCWQEAIQPWLVWKNGLESYELFIYFVC